jgi:hypothetical protein
MGGAPLDASKFRIALLLDRLSVSYSVKELFDWAQAQPDIEVCGLVLHPHSTIPVRGLGKLRQLATKNGWYWAISHAAYAFVVRLEKLYLQRRAFNRERLASYSIEHPVVVTIVPQVSTSGLVYRFSDEDVDKVRALDAHVLLSCGSGLLKGDILRASRYGIVSVHHGDNRVNRGGPPAYWEVLERQPSTGFSVQRLTEELDGGEVLCRGSIRTAPLHLVNQINLYQRANVCLKKTVRDLLTGNGTAEVAMVYDRHPYQVPLLHDTAWYVLKTAGFGCRKLWRKARDVQERWSVAYAFGPWQSAALWRAKTIPNPPDRFLADPFALEHQGSHYVFVEDYCYRTHKAVISAYRVGHSGAERLGVVIEEDFHLSFPCVFRHAGQIYMVPESAQNGDIRLYRCVAFPMQWEVAKVLIRGLTAVDTLLFEQEGKWWMLSTPSHTPDGMNDAELHLFEADSLFGEWKAHAHNPVMLDASRGRNGGLLRNGSAVYRVAQRHGFGEYGKGSTIYRIDALTPRYSETYVQDIDPHFLPGLKGTHHMHHDGGLLVFDYVRDERVRAATGGARKGAGPSAAVVPLRSREGSGSM